MRLSVSADIDTRNKQTNTRKLEMEHLSPLQLMSSFIFREMTDLTEELPVEILERIFQSLSLQDLSTALLVCRRWREVGETPALWSSLPVYDTGVRVDRRNLSVITGMLRSRLKAVRKITIYNVSPSEEDWMAMVEHPGLRDLTIFCLTECRLKAGLLGRVVARLERLNIRGRGLSVENIEEILRAVSEGSTMTQL